MIYLLQVLEANVSLTTLAERLQELNFNREKQDFLNEETEQVFSKMQSSFKDSFSQVLIQCFLNIFLYIVHLSDQRGFEAQARLFGLHQIVNQFNKNNV